MTEETAIQRATRLAEGIAAPPEREFLEVDRDAHRIVSRGEFTQAALHALAAGAFGTLAGAVVLAGAPLGLLAAIPAAVCVYASIHHFGRGVQEAADSVSADTTLRLAYEHEGMKPGHHVQEAASHGSMAHDHPQAARLY